MLKYFEEPELFYYITFWKLVLKILQSCKSYTKFYAEFSMNQ